MNDNTHDPSTAPPLPRAGQQRAWWRAPASASALAFHIAAPRARTTARCSRSRATTTPRTSSNPTCARCSATTATLPVLPFPDWETLPYDQFSPHPDIVSQRLAALHRLPTLKRGIVVVPVQTLLQRAARRCATSSATRFDVRVGQTPRPRRGEAPPRSAPATATCRRCSTRAISPCAAACSTCIRWARTSRTASSCSTTRSIRSAPSIRNRSARSTRSTRCSCCPAAKCRSTTTRCKRALDALRERFDIDTRRSALYQDLKAGLAPAGIEYYLPLFFEQTATLFDYLGDRMLPVLGDGALEARRRVLGADRRALRAAPPRHRTPAAAADRAVPAARRSCANAQRGARASKSAAASIRRREARRRSATSRRRCCRSLRARTRRRRGAASPSWRRIRAAC